MQWTKKLVGNEEERAVSPVIGVILMVAITVILAAVIAAFVLDLGPGDSTAPNAQIEMETNTDYDPTADTGPFATLNHQGGDAIPSDEVRIIIGTTTDDVELNEPNGFSDAADELKIDNYEGEELTVGGSLVIEDDGHGGIESGDEIDVTIIHTGSDTIIFENTVVVYDG